MTLIRTIGKVARVSVKCGIKLNLALLSRIKPLPPTTDNNSVAVLMYHRVNAYRKDELSVHPKNFVKHVRWLKENGFQNMKMRELEAMKKGDGISGRRVTFTFDDGYEDNYTEALPILKQYGYTGIFYLATDYIETNRMYRRDVDESNRLEHNRLMDWQHIHRLIEEGMEIGSHTMSHSLLTQLSDREVQKELLQSRLLLEEKLRIKITSFCLPDGAYFDKHIQMIREAGYTSSCTTNQGFWRGDNILKIPRIAVLASDGTFIFKQKLTGRMEWCFRFIH